MKARIVITDGYRAMLASCESIQQQIADAEHFPGAFAAPEVVDAELTPAAAERVATRGDRITVYRLNDGRYGTIVEWAAERRTVGTPDHHADQDAWEQAAEVRS